MQESAQKNFGKVPKRNGSRFGRSFRARFLLVLVVLAWAGLMWRCTQTYGVNDLELAYKKELEARVLLVLEQNGGSTDDVAEVLSEIGTERYYSDTWSPCPLLISVQTSCFDGAFERPRFGRLHFWLFGRIYPHPSFDPKEFQ